MAHAAETNRLTAELVSTSSPFQSKRATSLETRKKEALKIFSSTRAGRTNQFEVFARLEGVEERCLINNNPEVADALRDRRERLILKEEKWLPEILHLLLGLSDRPAEKSRIEDLFPPPPEQEAEQLTWNELIADDAPTNQDGIWSNIDYANEGTDSQASDDESAALSSRISHLSDDNLPEVDGGTYEDLIATVSIADLDSVKAAQSWRRKIPTHDSGVLLSERQLLRECLSMLDGLPTSAFETDESGLTIPKVGFRISYVFHSSLYDILRGFSHIGDALNTLRQWTSRDKACPVLETSRAIVKSHLNDIQAVLSEHASNIIKHGADSTSLLRVHDNLQKETRNTSELAKTLKDVENSRTDQKSVKLVDALYLKACDYQNIGDITGFEFFEMVSLRLLATYLKSIHAWMSSGEVSLLSTFFVKRSQDLSSMSDLWRGEFQLVLSANGNTTIPTILQPMIQRIFDTGKTTSFLKHLSDDLPKVMHNSDNDVISYEKMHHLARTDTLEPFAERLASHLDRWVRDEHSAVSKRLRHHLETECGLHRTLDSLEYLFLRRDGSLNDSFAREILSNSEHDSSAQRVSVHLTQILRDIYNGVPCVDPEAITARLQPASKLSVGGWILSDTVITRICILYTFPWSVANIIRQSTLTTYQRIHAVILQVVQAKLLQESLPFSKSRVRPGREALQADTLRQQLIWFTNTLLDYLCGIVLRVMTNDLCKDLAKAEGIDDMIQLHQKYIRRLEDQCLTSSKYDTISKALGAILNLAIEFAGECSRADKEENAHARNIFKKMQERYTKLLSFALAALKTSGRSATEPSLIILAEMLSSSRIIESAPLPL